MFISPLWRIAQGLTSLDLGFNSYTVGMDTLQPCPDPEGLPAMRHLVLGASYSAVQDQVRFLSSCKNLETLTWNLEHIRLGTTGVAPFHQLFTALQRLRELRLRLPEKQTFLEGIELSAFLSLLPQCVVEFQVQSYAVWNVSDALISLPLSRQFHVLETLNLRGWPISSNFIGAILRSCPLLRVFRCYTLRIKNPKLGTTVAGDVPSGGDNHGGIGAFGWECLGLETLIIQFVDCMDAATRRLFFDQLCCMKELTSVAVGGLVPTEIQWDEGESPRMWRDLTIDKDEISSIPWMRETWPRLESFCTYDNTTKYSLLSLFNHAWSG